MPTWIDDIRTALVNLKGSATLEELYAEIERIRPSALSPKWKTTVRRAILDCSSDSDGWKRRDDLFYSVEGLGAGVWGLRSSLTNTPTATDFQENGVPKRVLSQTYRVLRDTELARKLKLLHENKCQFCGVTLSLGGGIAYSEAHHIQPLGNPHHGPDDADNILVLCPIHHVLLDYGAIPLKLSELRTVRGHTIGRQYIQWHNQNVFKG